METARCRAVLAAAAIGGVSFLLIKRKKQSHAQYKRYSGRAFYPRGVS